MKKISNEIKSILLTISLSYEDICYINSTYVFMLRGGASAYGSSFV